MSAIIGCRKKYPVFGLERSITKSIMTLEELDTENQLHFERNLQSFCFIIFAVCILCCFKGNSIALLVLVDIITPPGKRAVCFYQKYFLLKQNIIHFLLYIPRVTASRIQVKNNIENGFLNQEI